MAQGARTREEPVVAQWQLPIKGVIKNIRDLEISPDALYNASNVDLIDGTLRGRLGLTAHTAQLFGASPLAALNFWQSTTAGWVVLVTTNKVWTLELATSTWTDRSGTLTATLDDPTKIVQFEFGTPMTNRVYICNGKDALKTWKPGDATATSVGGTPPLFRDLTVAADRLVGIVGSHEVRWGEPLTDTDFPALNSKVFGETASPLRAIQNMGVLAVGAYKNDSIWVGEVTGLAKASAFRWSLIDTVEGPAGPKALVDAGGLHIYMTQTGRIGLFNGVMHKWVADGVWKIVKDEIDQTKPNRVHGVYIPQLYQVRFYYPRTGQTTTDGLVILNLQQRDLGLPFAAFPGRMGKSITAGCAIYDASLGASLVFADNSGAEKTYKLEGATDDGTAVSSNMQTGLILAKNLEVGRVLSLEAFLERAGGYGTVTAKMVSSNILDSIDGALSAGSTIDLTQTPVKNPIGFDVRGRFLGLRLEWTSSDTVRYRGAVLRGQETL